MRGVSITSERERGSSESGITFEREGRDDWDEPRNRGKLQELFLRRTLMGIEACSRKSQNIENEISN